jgi:hypothetical protein
MTDMFTCLVCGTEFGIERHGDGRCPHCDQRYEYGEGHRMQLTPEQLQSVRRVGLKDVLPDARSVESIVGWMRTYPQNEHAREWADAIQSRFLPGPKGGA